MTLTPEQFNKLITRDEFNEKTDKLLTEIITTSDNVRELKNRVDGMDEKIDVIIGMLEKNAKKDSDHEIEHVSNIAAHDRFQNDIDQIKSQIKITASL